MRKPGAAEPKAWIANRRSRGLGGGIAIECEQPAARTECGEDCAGMPPASERCVDHARIGPKREAGQGFVKEDGNMAIIGHSEKPVSSGGNAPSGNATARAVCSVHRAPSHSSNLLP